MARRWRVFSFVTSPFQSVRRESALTLAIIWYKAPYIGQDEQAAQNPAHFLSDFGRGRAGARVAEEPRSGRPQRHRARPDARAVSLASRNAVVPSVGCRLVGSPHEPLQ